MKTLLSVLFIGCVTGCLSEAPGDDVTDPGEGGDIETPSPTDQAGDEEDTSTVDQASVVEGFVAGAGVVTDDFGDEGPVDADDHRNSLAAGMWQAILWADGARELDGTTFDASDIDCEFGPNTVAATMDWQRRHGADPDGSAGPMTFSRADNKLTISPRNATSSFVVYNGSFSGFLMIRKEGSGSANHAYQASADDNTLRVIFYSFISGCSSRTFGI